MKKVLFGTTALVGAALIASAAHAESPKVTVGGFLDFQAGWSGDQSTTPGSTVDNQRGLGFRNDTEVNFKIDGVTDAGLKYGGEVSLEADVDGGPAGFGGSDADAQGINSSKTFLYLEGSWGRFEAGSNIGADQTLKIDASTIARATGGIDGAFTYFVNGGTGTGAGTAAGIGYIVTPDLPMNYGDVHSSLGSETTENANKVTYYTPRWAGLQAGISFAPNQTDRGQLVTRLGSGANANGGTLDQYGDIWQGGVSYETSYNGFGIGLAGTGEYGVANAALGTEKLSAWQGGAKVSYLGFTVAGSYANLGSSGYLTAADVRSNVWTVGGAYEWGPFGASVTYLRSEVNPISTVNHRFSNLSFGVDWKLAPGFTPYVEVDDVRFDSRTTGDNDNGVLIVGSQLAF